MREEINGSTVYNEVKMLREQYKGAIILFESEDDLHTLKKFIVQEEFQCVISHGKKNALKAMKKLEFENEPGIIAILDNDYWIIEEKIISPNILTADNHDSETMLLQSEAFDDFLLEYASNQDIEEFEEYQGCNIREFLMDRCKFIGFFRMIISHFIIKAFALRDLKFNRITDFDNFIIDHEKLFNIALKPNLRQKKIDQNFLEIKTIITNFIHDLENNNYDSWQICCGHDMIKMLNIVLRKKFGNSHGQNLGEIMLGKNLRLAYSLFYFQQTNLYNSIMLWEQNNTEYKILNNS